MTSATRRNVAEKAKSGRKVTNLKSRNARPFFHRSRDPRQQLDPRRHERPQLDQPPLLLGIEELERLDRRREELRPVLDEQLVPRRQQKQPAQRQPQRHAHDTHDVRAAIGLYRKFGFETEGRHRGFALRDGRYVDAFAMARLHPDPPAAALIGSGEPA